MFNNNDRLLHANFVEKLLIVWVNLIYHVFTNATELHLVESINQILNECIGIIGIPVEKMGKYDRMRIIQLLHERNVFQMQKAVPYVAERLDISRFTVYNYLKELGIKD